MANYYYGGMAQQGQGVVVVIAAGMEARILTGTSL
jgi:hypothetical protein